MQEQPKYVHPPGCDMEDDLTKTIRENYDRLAEEYTRHLFDELKNKPLDRELLDRFAREVAGRGDVCDLGCGPGHVARYLHARGVPVFGLDLSPAMVAQARKLNPDIPFHEGNMLALEIPSGSLAGIAAFYAIVNLSKKFLPQAFQEMARSLQSGGLLLLAFHIGDEVIRVDTLWEKPITMDFFLFQPGEIRRYLKAAGFVVEEVIEREPYPEVEYQSRRAYVFARRYLT